jgi:hypothetical protein
MADLSYSIYQCADHWKVQSVDKEYEYPTQIAAVMAALEAAFKLQDVATSVLVRLEVRAGEWLTLWDSCDPSRHMQRSRSASAH